MFSTTPGVSYTWTIDGTILCDQYKYLFVAFKSKNCGHCHNMASAWNSLVEDNKNRDVAFVAIETSIPQKSIPQKVLPNGVPTLRLYDIQKSKVYEYSGDRSEQSMNHFISSKISPVTQSKQKMRESYLGETERGSPYAIRYL